MDLSYNKNYTKEQIKSILDVIQSSVRDECFTISIKENRQENIDFINNYNLHRKKQKDLLLKIQVEDFCYSLKNIKEGYEHEVLYVFCPQILLFNIDDEEELVDIYTKFNIINYAGGRKIIVISFHKRNKKVDYLFR